MLFWHDPSAPPPDDNLVRRAMAVLGDGRVTVAAGPPCMKGWPQGPNTMWAALCNRLARDPTFCTDSDVVFTSEADSMPWKADWAAILLAGHLAGGKTFSGHTVHRANEYAPTHINGNLVMDRGAGIRYPHMCVPATAAWDVEHAPTILCDGYDHPGILSRWGSDLLPSEDLMRSDIKPDAAWLHGCRHAHGWTEANRRLLMKDVEQSVIPNRLRVMNPVNNSVNYLRAVLPGWDVDEVRMINPFTDRMRSMGVDPREVSMARGLLELREGGVLLDARAPVPSINGYLEGAACICQRAGKPDFKRFDRGDEKADTRFIACLPGELSDLIEYPDPYSVRKHVACSLAWRPGVSWIKPFMGDLPPDSMPTAPKYRGVLVKHDRENGWVVVRQQNDMRDLQIRKRELAQSGTQAFAIDTKSGSIY